MDGRVVATSTDASFDLDSYITPEEITAIEIYRGPSETPAAFGGADSACGVIVVWTK
jgi:outer membrane receptor for ferrienterochelin and colicin